MIFLLFVRTNFPKDVESWCICCFCNCGSVVLFTSPRSVRSRRRFTGSGTPRSRADLRRFTGRGLCFCCFCNCGICLLCNASLDPDPSASVGSGRERTSSVLPEEEFSSVTPPGRVDPCRFTGKGIWLGGCFVSVFLSTK